MSIVASVARIRGSDGSTNASQMTVQTIRAPGATSILVNTVSGVPPNFFATMGTPHTFVDPVTSETITVISEATAVDFAGHLNSGHLEIDAIAPGYTDNGSAVGDIVIIKPSTAWADNIGNVLAQAHNDDGTLKGNAIAGQGQLINGKIVPSVASNNLTVAIKTLAGADPSATDPVYCRIGDTVRQVTAALSVTKNAGTNWFDSGQVMFASFEIDYFVYLGYNSTDGVTIGFSRIPYARTYADFSTTTTDGKYAAISTITHAASTDIYENVGRFNAILSASPSYNWSLPATSVIINQPTFETRDLSFLPQFTNLTVGNGTVTGQYYRRGKQIKGIATFQTGNTTSYGASAYQITIPIPGDTTEGGIMQTAGRWTVYDAVAAAAYGSNMMQLVQTTNPIKAYLLQGLAAAGKQVGATNGNFSPSVTGAGSFFEFKFDYKGY